MMKKLFAIMAVFCLLLSGCGAEEPEETQPTVVESNNTVGICLPGFAWSAQGEQLTALLEAAGYQVLLEYASGDAQLQHSQVQTLVNMPVGCLVVAAIDSLTLGDVLSDARQDGLPVIAFDRMLMYTEAVTGCVAVDSYTAGQQMGQYIIEKKQLATAKEPVTVEFLMGAPENNNSLLLYQGLMEQLQPYLVNGILQCRSGRTVFEDSCIQPETADAASERCFDYLAEFYAENTPDVLCAASDALAAGCIDALISFGSEPGEEWPLVTGAGATEEGMENILQGYQSVSLYTDTDVLVDRCAQWVFAAMEGKPLTGEEISNGAAQVPGFLQPVTLVDAENYKEILPQE